MEDFQKIKSETILLFSNSTSGNKHKWNENTNGEKYLYANVHNNLFIVAKTWKQSKCPLMDERIKKVWDNKYSTHWGIIQPYKDDATICNNMNEPWRHHMK